jgi:hypothetical protein
MGIIISNLVLNIKGKSRLELDEKHNSNNKEVKSQISSSTNPIDLIIEF